LVSKAGDDPGPHPEDAMKAAAMIAMLASVVWLAAPTEA
jgi:hypothetical protein